MQRLRHSNVRDLALSPDGALLASSGRHDLRVWRTKTGELVFEELFLSSPYSLHFSNVDQLLVGHDNGDLRQIDLRSGRGVVNHHFDDWRLTGLLAHEKSVFVGLERSFGHSVELVRLEEGGAVTSLVAYEPGGGVWYLALDPERNRLAALVVDGHFMEYVAFWLFDLSSGSVRAHRLGGTMSLSGSLEFARDGRLLAGPDPIQGRGLRLFDPDDMLNGRHVEWAWANEGTMLTGDWIASRNFRSFSVGTSDECLGFAGSDIMGPERPCLRRSPNGVLASCVDDETVQVETIEEMLASLREDED